MTPDCDLCDLCPQLTFDLLFPTVTQYHKTAHTVSPNELDQISLPWASMPPMCVTIHSSIVQYEWKQVKYYNEHFKARKVGVAIDLIINHKL